MGSRQGVRRSAVAFGQDLLPLLPPKLRTADIVRYDTRSKQTRYWLKHKREIRDLLNTLNKVIGVTGPLQ